MIFGYQLPTFLVSKTSYMMIKSRNFNDQLKWKLGHDVFNKLCAIWQRPEIYVFATRLNYQIDKFGSWEPDPQSSFVNAFTLNWSVLYIVYMVSSFQYTEPLHSENQDRQSKRNTDTQTWFTALKEILIDNPRVISRKTNLLTPPHQDNQHPLWKNRLSLHVECPGNVQR